MRFAELIDVIKVLIPHRMFSNIYVRELGRAYKDLGCEVVYGPENLFEANYKPDVIHLNWPEDLYRRSAAGDMGQSVDRLRDRLHQARSRDSTIAWTVHNERPHEQVDDDVDYRAYQCIVNSANVIHHHCECSQVLVEQKYEVPADTIQFVAPHGHYFGYKDEISRDEARRRLGLSDDKFVFLHFGAIRGYKGIDLVLAAFRRARRKRDVMLVAGRMLGTGSFAARLKLAPYKYFAPTVHWHLRMIDSDEIQVFLNAADAIVLGHTSGLNSGVAVLGMSFGKPVVGPNLGCISSVLDQGINLMYETENVEDMADKLVQVREVDLAAAEVKNKAAAKSWDWKAIAEPVLRTRQVDG